MARACHTAVRMATGEVFSEKEIDDLLNRLEGRAYRAGKGRPGAPIKEHLAQAAAEMTRDELMAALTERRLAAASKIAKAGRAARLNAMPAEMTPAQKLNAFNVGDERQGFGTSASVDAEARARQMSLWGQVEVGLRQMPGLIDRVSNFWGAGEKGFDRLVAREMARLNGASGVEPTGDEGALHAARVFVMALDDARVQQNDHGAWISKQEGYIGRQSHDPGKIAGGLWRELSEFGRRMKAAGMDPRQVDWAGARLAAQKRAFGEWRDFILAKLDPRTFEGVDAQDIETQALDGGDGKAALKDPTDLREAFLHAVWMDVVTGRHAELSGAGDEGDFRPKPSLARSVSKSRVLHFKDSDAWMDYASRYGRGGLFYTVMSQLERSGRNAALMKHWGPAPEAAFDAEKSRLAEALRAAGDAKGIKQLDGVKTLARFEAVMGRSDTAANLRLASTMRTIRGFEALTKLGSIVLSKATDLPMTGHTMARAGAGFLRGYGAFFQGVTRLGGEEAKRAADALDVGARSFAGHMGSQYQASDGAAGWTSWATRLMYRLNAFEWFNNGVRKGAAEVYSRFLGQEAERDWAGLQPGTRETFERFGITPADWDQARAGLEAAPDGRTYFTLEHLDGNRELALKFATAIHNVVDDTVSEPRARERAFAVGGSKAGTLWGEIQRSFWQFKGFVNAIVGRHLIPATQGYAGYSPVALMAHLVLGSALAGYVSMNAKRIARGEMPKAPIGEDLGETAKIWGASLAQGGGLGLYGDFLFGELDRQGHNFGWGDLAGPMMSDSEAVANVVLQALHGGAVNPNTGRSAIPGELVKLAGQNIPLVNLWYTRLAIDYLVLWRLQEAASPGYLQRYEQRVRTQEGSDFILSPTSAQ